MNEKTFFFWEEYKEKKLGDQWKYPGLVGKLMSLKKDYVGGNKPPNPMTGNWQAKPNKASISNKTLETNDNKQR